MIYYKSIKTTINALRQDKLKTQPDSLNQKDFDQVIYINL